MSSDFLKSITPNTATSLMIGVLLCLLSTQVAALSRELSHTHHAHTELYGDCKTPDVVNDNLSKQHCLLFAPQSFDYSLVFYDLTDDENIKLSRRSRAPPVHTI